MNKFTFFESFSKHNIKKKHYLCSKIAISKYTK